MKYIKNAPDYIFNELRGKDHYINDMCAYRYYNDFWICLKELSEAGFFETKRAVDEMSNKLRIRTKFNMSQYLQGVSEVMLWNFFCRKKCDFEIDVQLNKDKNTDVDIQVMYNDCLFNIEVKCPELANKKIDKKVEINTGFRTMEKSKRDKEFKKLEGDILQQMIKNSGGEIEGFKYKKIDDTKVLTYLTSCDEKFKADSSRELNVLFIALPSYEINNYWGYLFNTYSGIFTEKFQGQYYNKDGREYTDSDIEKTDVVILSNMISGHLRPRDTFNSWMLEDYFNLLCMNIHGCTFRENPDDPKFSLLYELIPNDNSRFELEYTQMENEIMCRKLYDLHPDVLFMNSYLSKYFRQYVR